VSADLRLCDVVWLVAEMHTSRAITAGQAVEILADIADLTLIMSAQILREFEREEHGEPADQWTPEVDDWRKPTRGDDGTWG
jgi:hypothetical protein